MTRLAWFTPLPPIRSGIAQYNRELLPMLLGAHEIDLFVDDRPEHLPAPVPGAALFRASDFLWKHRERPYDLIVYQLGNAPCHDYMWAYFIRYPGMVVLHDGQLHHARGRLLLQRRRHDDYRREFWFNHPDADPDLAELGAAGLLSSLTYLWPMLRTVVESSRLVVVHNEWLAGQMRESHPGSRIDAIEMGVPEAAEGPGARERVRARHGIPADAVVFTALGRATPEKRIREALRALASLADAAPRACLLLAGETVDYYDLRAEAQTLGVEAKVIIAGYVPDEEVGAYLAASDVCLCMRWPTSRETSASWLRCLAAGKPTISTDLVHTIDIPTLDPRTWAVLEAAGLKAGATGDVEPVAVSIDIRDEDHSLRLGMRRLATDARLRATLGGNARALWAERFGLDQMAAGYERAIAAALAAPPPDGLSRAMLPEHLRATGIEHAQRLLRDAGFPPDIGPGLQGLPI